jgi:DNA-directed RNA polymerase subunit beta'
MEIYKPFVVREMRSFAGVSPLKAQQLIADGDELAKRALERVVTDRPLLLKRDPVLHKYGVQAFKPVLTSGKAVKIHPLVTSGYNADFDGDTMAAFVPVSNDAVDEAKKMFPSRNLFSPATGKLMYRPTHESQLGLYMLNQEGKKTNTSFNTMAEAAEAAKKGKVGLTDSVKIGQQRTTVGRALIANALPEPMRQGVLTGKMDMDGAGQSALLTQVAKEHKNDFGEVANKLKDLGNKYASTNVLSIGLEDIRADKRGRDRILANADRKVQEIMARPGSVEEKQKKAVQVYDAASASMVRSIEQTHGEKGKNLYHMMKAGVKPQMDAYRQAVMAPMLMMNAKGEVIPTPIRRSWSEGLDTADYWTQMSGARKGVVQKVQSVQEPGYFTKQVINSVMNNSISTDDCGTKKGISLPVDEKDILDRRLASSIKVGKKTYPAGMLVTPGVRDSLRNNKVRRVVVRSPLRCEHGGTGICSKCYGLDENGQDAPVGKNVGIISAQAIGERATQLAMRVFHEGGVAPVGAKGRQKAVLTDEFNRVQQLVGMPEHVPGSAPLSTISGKVDKIQRDPAGGTNVFVGGVRHYVPQNRGEPLAFSGEKSVKLKKGMTVGKGDPLSAGPVNPHELLPLAGINKTQSYMAGQLYGLYQGQGIRRRNIETVVKSMTNLSKVRDPGDDGEFIRGDFAPTSKLQAINKQLSAQGKKPVVHTPVLKGVKTLPLDMQTDWMARLNHEDLNSTIIDAANQGWSSNIHGNHPIPALAYGAEFGKGKPY